MTFSGFLWKVSPVVWMFSGFFRRQKVNSELPFYTGVSSVCSSALHTDTQEEVMFTRTLFITVCCKIITSYVFPSVKAFSGLRGEEPTFTCARAAPETKSHVGGA